MKLKSAQQFVLIAASFLIAATASYAIAAPQAEVIGQFQQRPGNPAVGPDGTVYFSMHPFDNPKFKVMKLVDGKGVPYPNEKVSSSFAAVIGVWAESNGLLWMLDMGSPTTSPKLVGWDTKENKLAATHYLPKEVSVANSFHQDVVVDEKRRSAYIADMTRGGMIDESNPAIVVVNLVTGQMRRVLQGHEFFEPKSGATMMAAGMPMLFMDAQGKKHSVELGLNPIAIDGKNEWVYFSTMNPGTLYRVKSELLGDFSKSDQEIEGGIERFADKPSCDGMVADSSGRVFITNVDKSAISVATTEGTSIWFQDDRLVWPDGLAITKDGAIIVTVDQLCRAAPFNGGSDGAVKPFVIMKIKN